MAWESPATEMYSERMEPGTLPEAWPPSIEHGEADMGQSPGINFISSFWADAYMAVDSETRSTLTPITCLELNIARGDEDEGKPFFPLMALCPTVSESFNRLSYATALDTPEDEVDAGDRTGDWLELKPV